MKEPITDVAQKPGAGNRTQALGSLGQSVWLDYLRRTPDPSPDQALDALEPAGHLVVRGRDRPPALARDPGAGDLAVLLELIGRADAIDLRW